MKHTLLILVSGLLLTGVSQAAFMATSLPTTGGLAPATVATGNIYGSTFTLTGEFFAYGAALYTGTAPGFSADHTVSIWKLNGTSYDPIDSVTFSTVSPGTPVVPSYGVNNFASQDFASTLRLTAGDYFIGYSNANAGDQFLTMSPSVVLPPNNVGNPLQSDQIATIGGATNQINSSIAGFSFSGVGVVPITSLVGGSFTEISTGAGQNIKYANAGNLNVFASLVAVPETGSVVMGAFLTGMAVSYRRRSKLKA